MVVGTRRGRGVRSYGVDAGNCLERRIECGGSARALRVLCLEPLQTVDQKVLTMFLVAALGVGGTSVAASSGSRVVTAAGRIGPLQVDKSTRAAVIAFAGAPDAERRGQEPGGGALPAELRGQDR